MSAAAPSSPASPGSDVSVSPTHLCHLPINQTYLGCHPTPPKDSTCKLGAAILATLLGSVEYTGTVPDATWKLSKQVQFEQGGVFYFYLFILVWALVQGPSGS